MMIVAIRSVAQLTAIKRLRLETRDARIKESIRNSAKAMRYLVTVLTKGDSPLKCQGKSGLCRDS
jgi:hypothetical protein